MSTSNKKEVEYFIGCNNPSEALNNFLQNKSFKKINNEKQSEKIINIDRIVHDSEFYMNSSSIKYLLLSDFELINDYLLNKVIDIKFVNSLNNELLKILSNFIRLYFDLRSKYDISTYMVYVLYGIYEYFVV